MKRLLLVLALAAAIAGPPLRAQAPPPEPAPQPPADNVDEAAMGPGTGLTIYNGNYAIVKERRQIAIGKPGDLVRFADVARYIVPDSVQFSSLTDPAGTKVIEQNFEYDLVSASKLLDKYIDKSITLVLEDGSSIKGTLMSFDEGRLVLDTGNGIVMVPRQKNVRNIEFSELPGGLITKPTLVWKIGADKPGQHLVKIAYRTDNITWRCDYRAVASADLKTVDLSGWVTVMNNSGASYNEAQLKLMAGDVHTVQPRRELAQLGTRVHALDGAKGAGEGFEEKSFAEYHLYTLGRPATLLDRQTKQIELMVVNTIPVERKYRYAGGRYASVILEFKNDEEVVKGLGIALPKGPVRVFAPDTDKSIEFLTQTEIDHTPKKELVKLAVGNALDVVGEVKQLNVRNIGQYTQQYDFQVRVRNHKDEPISLEVWQFMDFGRQWEIVKQSQDYRPHDYRTVIFDVKLDANSEKVITYTVEYTHP